jgi:hypothetical protein
MLRLLNRDLARARSLTVTGLNRPFGGKRVNEVCPATPLAHAPSEHEHEHENE